MNAIKTLKTFAAAALTIAALAVPAQADYYDYSGDSDSFGNNDFGADYWFFTKMYDKDGYVRALGETVDMYQTLVNQGFTGFQPNLDQANHELFMAEHMLDDAYFRAQAYGEINATVFGKDKSIVRAEGNAYYERGRFATDQRLTVMGASIDLPDPTSRERTLASVEKTFVKVSTTIWAAGIPLTVKGSVDGELGVDGSVSIGDGLTFGLTPYANLSASASVGVGLACASAGVQGSVDLLDVAMPNEVTFDIKGCGFSVDIESSLEMTTMSGSIGLYAELCGIEWEEELVSWDGIDLGSWDLIDEGFCL